MVQHSCGLWSTLQTNRSRAGPVSFPPEEGDRAQLANPDACAGVELCLHDLKMAPGPSTDFGLF